MSVEIAFLPIAIKELQESFDWYEERSDGLGEIFVEAIDKSSVAILLNPLAYPRYKSRYRQFVVDKFPYVIIYEFLERSDQINILHIFHTSRNPKYKYRRK
jgi:hypothetical protein